MILVCDGNGLCHLLYHAATGKVRKESGNPEAKADKGDVYDWFLIRLDNLRVYTEKLAQEIAAKWSHCGEWRTTKFIVVFDGRGPCFRKSIDSDYKADREGKRDPAIYECIDFAEESLKYSDEWTGVRAPNEFEADDLVASIAAQANEPVLIHSNDNDYSQCLVRGRVGIIKRSGVQENYRNGLTHIDQPQFAARHYKHQDFVDEYGFPPSRWVEYISMVGGKNNIKGADWIGKKKAREILEEAEFLKTNMFAVVEEQYVELNAKQEAGWPGFLARFRDLQQIHTLRTDLKNVKEVASV